MNKVNERNSSKKCSVNSGLHEGFDLTNTSNKSNLNGYVNGVTNENSRRSNRSNKKKNKPAEQKKNESQTTKSVADIGNVQLLDQPITLLTNAIEGSKNSNNIIDKKSVETNITGAKPKKRDSKSRRKNSEPKENLANDINNSQTVSSEINSIVNHESVKCGISETTSSLSNVDDINSEIIKSPCSKDNLISDLNDLKLEEETSKKEVSSTDNVVKTEEISSKPNYPPIDYIQYENELQMPMIMKLIQKDLSEPYSIYTYRYFIHNWPKLCFLAICEEKCVGAIVCKLDLHRGTIRRGYIAMLAVDQNYRKRGIGSTLVRKAIEEMIAGNADEVVLETEITNKPALQLYEALGFVRDKRLFRYYLNGVDALRLKLWLR